MSSPVSDLVTEINDSAAMVETRSKSGGDINLLREKLASSFARKVNQLSAITSPDAKYLLEATQASGLAVAGRNIVIAAIDNKLESTLEEESSGGKASSTNQLLTNPENYATSEIVATLASPSVRIDTKIVVVAEFLVKLGVASPHEQTYKHWLAFLLLLHFGDKFPKYKLIHGLLLDLKSAVVTSKKKPPFAAIKKYPKWPSELPQVIADAIYDTSQPTMTSVPRLAITAKFHIPLRKNSKLITQRRSVRRLSPQSLCSVPAPRLRRFSRVLQHSPSCRTPSRQRHNGRSI